MPGSALHLPHERSRLLFLDALRALASLVILWHHFASYPPLCEQARPLLGWFLDWLHAHARVTQVFFVVGGYVMCLGMEGKAWNLRAFGWFVVHRYARLGIPYLVAVVLVVVASSFGRGVLPEVVTGASPGLLQLLAHVFFLQDLLGMESLSAGLWFVCINFQLGLVYSAMLVLRDVIGSGEGMSRWYGPDMLLGGVLAGMSLFVFNGHPEWDATALYFFPHFFLGVLARRCAQSLPDRWLFLVYLMVFGVALVHDWRGRLVAAMVVGCLLVAAERFGWMHRWPRSRWVARLGRISYSLFLVHFPVLLLVSTIWVRAEWEAPWQAVCGLGMAFLASLAAAALMERWVERPASGVARRWSVRSRANRVEYPPVP